MAITGLMLLSVAHADSSLQVGDQAADWVLADHEGKTITFYQDSGDQPAVLLFWASWCSTCNELMPKLDTMLQELDHEVRLYALNIWEESAPLNYLKEQDFSFTLLLNADRVAKRYKVRRTPGLFIVNADKSINYVRRRGDSHEDIFAAIKAVANQSAQ